MTLTAAPKNNVTIIINGHRTRGKEQPAKSVAKIPGNKSPKTMEALFAAWDDALTKVPEENFVPGAGENGIFSERTAESLADLAPLENVWCPSQGLGMVNLAALYPQYDLGDYETSMRDILGEEGQFSQTAWWNHVCAYTGNSIKDVINDAMSNGRRVIMSLPTLQYYQYRDDLHELIKEHMTNNTLQRLREHVRIIGLDADSVIPARLLGSVMPFDREALNRLVPGTKAQTSKRVAKLFLETISIPKNGRGNPLDDSAAFAAVLADMKREPIQYEMGASSKTVRKSLPDEQATALVFKYAEEVGQSPARIVRMIREEGFSITPERVEEILSGPQPEPDTTPAPKKRAAGRQKAKA